MMTKVCTIKPTQIDAARQLIRAVVTYPYPIDRVWARGDVGIMPNGDIVANRHGQDWLARTPAGMALLGMAQ